MRRPGSFSVQDLLKHERKSESFSALPLPEDPVFGADKVKREVKQKKTTKNEMELNRGMKFVY